MAAVILLLTTAGIAEIINNSTTGLDQVPAEYLLKAQSSLRVMCFVSGEGESLKCANTSIQAHGRKFTCNKAGFGGAMADNLSEVPSGLRKQIYDANTRMRSLEIHADVKKEQKAGEQLSRESEGINRDLKAVSARLKRTAEEHPDTYTAQKAKHMADQLSGLMQFIK